jgi:hypothetical protein
MAAGPIHKILKQRLGKQYAARILLHHDIEFLEWNVDAPVGHDGRRGLGRYALWRDSQ